MYFRLKIIIIYVGYGRIYCCRLQSGQQLKLLMLLPDGKTVSMGKNRMLIILSLDVLRVVVTVGAGVWLACKARDADFRRPHGHEHPHPVEKNKQKNGLAAVQVRSEFLRHCRRYSGRYSFRRTRC